MKCPNCKTKILELEWVAPTPPYVWVCHYCGYSMDSGKFYFEQLIQKMKKR